MTTAAPRCTFLAFDATDNGDDTGTWEAMASAPAGDLMLQRIGQEMQAVVHWVAEQAPGPRGPQEDGGEWDADITATQDGGWTTLTLTLTGPWAWGSACVAALQEAGGPGVA